MPMKAKYITVIGAIIAPPSQSLTRSISSRLDSLSVCLGWKRCCTLLPLHLPVAPCMSSSLSSCPRAHPLESRCHICLLVCVSFTHVIAPPIGPITSQGSPFSTLDADTGRPSLCLLPSDSLCPSSHAPFCSPLHHLFHMTSNSSRLDSLLVCLDWKHCCTPLPLCVPMAPWMSSLPLLRHCAPPIGV